MEAQIARRAPVPREPKAKQFEDLSTQPAPLTAAAQDLLWP